MVCVYVCFCDTLGPVLTHMFQYFYFLLKKYLENSNTFYFYLNEFFQSNFF